MKLSKLELDICYNVVKGLATDPNIPNAQAAIATEIVTEIEPPVLEFRRLRDETLIAKYGSILGDDQTTNIRNKQQRRSYLAELRQIKREKVNLKVLSAEAELMLTIINTVLLMSRVNVEELEN